MRIISQEKTIDIPYERCCLQIRPQPKYGKYFEIWADSLMLGTYFTCDDARAVLWAIAANYKAGKDYYEMPEIYENLEYAYRDTV